MCVEALLPSERSFKKKKRGSQTEEGGNQTGRHGHSTGCTFAQLDEKERACYLDQFLNPEARLFLGGDMVFSLGWHCMNTVVFF